MFLFCKINWLFAKFPLLLHKDNKKSNEKMTRNAQPALVRAFFASFAEGILSAEAERMGGEVEMTPQSVKQVMLNHYEEISHHFFDIMFYPLALLYYDTAEELIDILRSPEVAPTLKAREDLFLHVCRTEEAHEDMVTEYRRNFSALLGGRVMTLDDFFDGFPEGYLEEGGADYTREIRVLTQVVVRSFFAGRKVAAAEGMGGSNQICLYRLLLDTMQCLLHTAPVDMSDETDLTEAFLTVCRGEENMMVMMQTMQEELSATTTAAT